MKPAETHIYSEHKGWTVIKYQLTSDSLIFHNAAWFSKATDAHVFASSITETNQIKMGIGNTLLVQTLH